VNALMRLENYAGALHCMAVIIFGISIRSVSRSKCVDSIVIVMTVLTKILSSPI
jgi:hypothetical protein